MGRRAQHVGDLAKEVGPAVLIDGDVVDLREREFTLAQAVGDRLRGKPGPVLDPVEALLFRRRNEHPSRTRAAAESPWKALSPRMIIQVMPS